MEPQFSVRMFGAILVSLRHYVCVVGDTIIEELEKALNSLVTDAVLSEPPPEVRFAKPATDCERIPIEKLRQMRTVSPPLKADFNAVKPKIVHRKGRFWYVVPARPTGQMAQYYQESSDKIVMCSMCSNTKAEGKP